MVKKNIEYKRFLNRKNRSQSDIKFYKSLYKSAGASFWSSKTRIEIENEQKQDEENKQRFDNIIIPSIKQEVNNRKINKALTSNNINKVLSIVANKKYRLSDTQFDKLINATGPTQEKMNYLKIAFNNKKERWIPINDKTTKFIKRITHDIFDYDEMGIPGSDTLNFVSVSDITGLSLESMNRKTKQKDGAYFNYNNISSENLTRYQIYKEDDDINYENCLIHTFKLYEINNDLINKIKLEFIKATSIKKNDLHLVGKIINKCINVYEYDNNNNLHNVKYNKENNDVINICLYKNHYFIYEKTKYSHYCIDNYNEVKDKDNFYNMYKKNRYSTTEKKLTSLNLIKKLFENNLFQKLNRVNHPEYNPDKEENIFLDNIDDEQRLIKDMEKPKEHLKNIWFGDLETFVNGDKHELFLYGCCNYQDKVYINNVNDFKDNEKYKKEQLMIYSLLKNITDDGKQDAIIYFHNLKYDYTILEQYLYIQDKCEKDNQIYNIKARYKNKIVEFRDSFKLLSFPLSKFQKEFKLPEELNKKEAINYNYYDKTKTNDEYKMTNIKEYENGLPYNQVKIFNDNIKPFLTSDITFNALEYYKYYLKYDCLVLKAGIQSFNKLILEITDNNLSVFDCLTISSLTDKFMLLYGAYKNVYEVKGNLRDYIGRAVFGGRVLVNPKYEKKVLENVKISDFDGVSLYPSAIKRLCEELGGLPTGKATRYLKDEFKNWKNKKYSILTIRVLKVNKIQQMPMIASKGKMSTEYTNEVPTDNLIIDSITLTDYITFHKIDYEIIDGIYWNEETNNKMGEVINKLFQQRLKAKKEGNDALQMVLKLMLNSAYGKTLLKKSDNEIKIKNASCINEYIFNNFNTINEVRKLNEQQYEIHNIVCDTSYNRAHIGTAILSTSKRIMNEVFNICNDNDINLYYTDTDSMHLDFDKIKVLEDEYFKTYNKVLTGKGLGQFHSDFSIKGAVGDVYATKSIFLGRKCYIDVIEGKDKNGMVLHDTHFRLKGITLEGIEHQAKKFNNDFFMMYKELSSSKPLNFLLNPYDKENNKQKVLFDFKNGIVKTKSEFYRELKF